MYTRQQYLNSECTHEEYYAQFVTPFIKQAVARRFGVDKLKAAFASDTSFNNIPLQQWDMLAKSLHYLPMKEYGDYWALAGMVCTVKEAARQLVDELA